MSREATSSQIESYSLLITRLFEMVWHSATFSQDEINVISYVGLSSQVPLRQLKPLTSYNKSMNCIEYFFINIVTVQETSFQ